MDQYIVFEIICLSAASISLYVAMIVLLAYSALNAARALLEYDRHDDLLTLIDAGSWPAITGLIAVLCGWIAMNLFPTPGIHALIVGT